MEHANTNDKINDQGSEERSTPQDVQKEALKSTVKSKQVRKATSVATPGSATTATIQPAETQAAFEEIGKGDKKYVCKTCGEVFTHG